MANCAMLVDDIGHSTSTFLRNALQNKGHTVAELQVGTVTATSLENYDSIFLPRTTPSVSVAGHLRNYIQQGIPVWGGLREPEPLKMGRYEIVGSNPPRPRVFDTTHWLFAGMPKGDVSIHESTTFRMIPGISTDYIRSLTHCVETTTDRRPDGLLFLPHIKDSDGVPFGGICGLFTWIYAQSAFTANGEEALHRLATLKPSRVSGTVLGYTGAAAAMTVRVFDRATGEIIDEVSSDPTSGAFEAWGVAGREMNIIAYDDGTGQMIANDQIQRTDA